MRKLFLVPALAVAIGAYFFWIWAGQSPPEVAPESQREALANEVRHLKHNEAVPAEWQERARKLGADPEKARRLLQAGGQKLENPDSAYVWVEALNITVREAEEARNRLDFYRQWRIPVCIAGGAVTLLLVALAFTPPKPAREE